MSENFVKTYEFLKKQTVMSLATIESTQPWICNVFFAVDEDLNLYFTSSKKSRHASEILKSNKVAACVYEHSSGPGKAVGVQIEGVAEVVEFAQIPKAMAIYLGKFPASKLNVKALTEVGFSSAIFKVTPSLVYYLNKEEVGGRAEVVRK